MRDDSKDISYGVWLNDPVEPWYEDLTYSSIRYWASSPDIHSSVDLYDLLEQCGKNHCLIQSPGHFVYRSFFYEALIEQAARDATDLFGPR